MATVAIPDKLNLTEAMARNLNVTYTSHVEQKQPKLVFWNLTSFTPTEMTVQLEFEGPALVSSGSILDNLEVSIDSEFFAKVNLTFPKPPDAIRTNTTF